MLRETMFCRFEPNMHGFVGANFQRWSCLTKWCWEVGFSGHKKHKFDETSAGNEIIHEIGGENHFRIVTNGIGTVFLARFAL